MDLHSPNVMKLAAQIWRHVQDTPVLAAGQLAALVAGVVSRLNLILLKATLDGVKGERKEK